MRVGLSSAKFDRESAYNGQDIKSRAIKVDSASMRMIIATITTSESVGTLSLASRAGNYAPKLEIKLVGASLHVRFILASVLATSRRCVTHCICANANASALNSARKSVHPTNLRLADSASSSASSWIGLRRRASLRSTSSEGSRWLGSDHVETSASVICARWI